jgi:hypothetical protein
MKAILTTLLFGCVSFSAAKTVDCGIPCQEVYSTDAQGALRFGLEIDKVTLSDPPITRVEIVQSENPPCLIEWVDLAIGESHSGLGSEAVVSIKSVSDISGFSIKNHLINTSKLYFGIHCGEKGLQSIWQGNARENILSVQLGQ